jgi:hypothetical protein
MNKLFLLKAAFVFTFVGAFVECSDLTDNPTSPDKMGFTKSTTGEFAEVTPTNQANRGFVHGIVISVDGDDYYFAGAPDGPNGSFDIPGHYWVQASPDMLVGKHYNTGPFGAAQWWSSDAPDGEYLYKVHAIIDTWTLEKAEMYARRGYIHYHELVKVSDGSLHPNKVVWLKHTARTSFTLDGGPGAPNPPYEHQVTPGVDYLFPVNGLEPYDPS